MNSQKTLNVIESIKNMTDREADALEIFISGFIAGKKFEKDEIEQQSCQPPENRTA